MSVGLIQSITTPLALIAFLGVVWWAYGSKRRAKEFDEVANSLFDPEEEAVHRATLASKEKDQ